MQGCSKLFGIPDSPKVHEEHPRAFVQHVPVNGRYINAVLAEDAQHRINFVARQNKIARDRCFTTLDWLKVNRGCDTHPGRDAVFVVIHRMAARNCELEHDSGTTTLYTEDLSERLDV
jgi:hypothetical protein